MDESHSTPTTVSPADGKAGVSISSANAQSTGEGKPIENRPPEEVPEPAAKVTTIGELSEKVGILGRRDEEIEKSSLADANVASAEGVEVKFRLRDGSREQVDMCIPPVNSGNLSRVRLVEETKADPSLDAWRKLADAQEQGFSWGDDLLYQSTTTHVLETAHLIALPLVFREKVLKLAHDRLGHLGARKVKALIKQRFTWPGMGQDVIECCRSCVICQRCSKAPARKAPMIECEVLSEPFEALAFIVGPMPKEKGGFRFLLTAICMASKWPEALPLRSITARAVAQGMMIFSRTGVLQLLSNQGAQFGGL